MSGGASPPAAPSLGTQIGQSNQTFGTATANSAQATNAANAYNANANANLQTALGTTNANAASISQQANNNMSSYATNFQPLQAQEAQAASQYGSNANIQKLTGQAVGNVNAANQAAQQNNAAALASEGVDPASIHGGAIQAAGNVQGAAAAANAGTQASTQAQQQAFNMQNTANNLGLNVAQQGTAGAATGAQVAQGGQAMTNQTGATGIQNLSGANQMLGVANTANQNAMTGQQDQFSDQQQIYSDQQQQAAGTMQGIGQIAGMAAMFMEGGGTVPDISGWVPPKYPTSFPQPRGIPAPRKVLAGGHVTDYAAGGQVMQKGALPTSPIPGSTDTKPALLTPGEFVIPKDVVSHLGAEHFHKLIDSTREKSNQRRAIPIHHPPHQSMQ
jgi:hypothetical protein